MSAAEEMDPERAEAERLAALTSDQMNLVYASALASGYDEVFGEAPGAGDCEALVVVAVNSAGGYDVLMVGETSPAVCAALQAATLDLARDGDPPPVGGIH